MGRKNCNWARSDGHHSGGADKRLWGSEVGVGEARALTWGQQDRPFGAPQRQEGAEARRALAAIQPS